ncbi:hypothetical protein [Halorarius litoreus]|uniref:hypothetical protein n=1 Tax=Halorarius litoreus TaxID=2962676 RepID=UPI0020CB9C31|nr:hypothetical protein [Halorarius litoreus]
MPSRRTLLTGVTTAAATALAGCSSSRSLPPATQTDTPRAPPDATVIATDETLRDAEPYGAFRQSSIGYEHTDAGGYRRLYVLTHHHLVPGTDQFGTGWRLVGCTVDHDYHYAAPTGATTTAASYAPVDPDTERPTPVRMARAQGDEAPDLVDRWLVRYAPASDATWGPTFLTEVTPSVTFREGDRLASTRLRVEVTDGWLDDAAFELTTALRYGRDG